MDSTSNNVIQPKPQITQEKKSTKRLNTQPNRKINRPYVGVVDVPYISTTPLSDTISIKGKENPQMKYKITLNKKHSDVKLDGIISLSIIGCALLSLLKIIKK